MLMVLSTYGGPIKTTIVVHVGYMCTRQWYTKHGTIKKYTKLTKCIAERSRYTA